jgi:hypothetical protein
MSCCDSTSGEARTKSADAHAESEEMRSVPVRSCFPDEWWQFSGIAVAEREGVHDFPEHQDAQSGTARRQTTRSGAQIRKASRDLGLLIFLGACSNATLPAY